MKIEQVHPTAIVSASAELGVGVTVGPYSIIGDGARIGDGSVVGSHCVIGEPTAEFYGSGENTTAPTMVGAGAVIRSHTVLYRGVRIGGGFECGHRVTIREGSVIGEGVRVGTSSDLQGHLSVGDYTRIHSNVFVAQQTAIEAFCWLFPGVVITDDPHPPSDTCSGGATIRRFAAIAARAVLLPGVEIGEQALVGAMSLVTRDVEPGMVVVGSPAKPVGPITDVKCRHEAGVERDVYPWPDHFRRGYPDGVLPEPGTLGRPKTGGDG